MGPLVSIIIPVYNAENYLDKCLKSIMLQTYRNMEIIIVNDGSIDDSGHICDKYANIDNRINVIHKSNAGVSSARNVGINLANGKYIGFIDSDDYIDQGMIERLVVLAMQYKADISMCGCIKERSDGTIFSKKSDSFIHHYSKVDAMNNILDKNEFHGYVCNKLFLSEIIKSKDKICFDEEIHICEDLLFCCECFNKATKILYDSTKYYHYVFHDNNTSSKFNIKNLTALRAYDKIFNLLSKNAEFNVRDFKTNYVQIIISFMMQNMNEHFSVEIDQILKQQLYRFDISELTNFRIKFASLLMRVCPVLTKLILKIIRKNRK